MGYNSCSKHPASAAVGRCSDCGVYFCASCRRFLNGVTYCRSCHQKRWYKENKQFKDKLQYGKYKTASKTSLSKTTSTFIQLLIFGIIGLIAYKVCEKKGFITKDSFSNLGDKIKNFNPNDSYSARITETKLNSFKKIVTIYSANNNGNLPDNFEQFLNEMFEDDQREINRKDAWGIEFVYRYNSANNSYQFISAGPDKQIDTDDDIIISNKKNK